MLKTALTLSVSIFALVIALGGAVRTTHADGPGFQFDLSGLSGLVAFTSGPGDWSQAVVPTPVAAPAPQSAIERPAIGVDAAPAPEPAASIPKSDAAPRTMQLPSTGMGASPDSPASRFAAIVAALGVVCVGTARLIRSRRRSV